jgi:hypothetical protein
VIPAPFTAASAELLAQDHRQLVDVALTHPDWGVLPVELRAADGDRLSVTFDEATSPRASAQLSCSLPDQSVDPRTGVRLTVDVGYQPVGDGPQDVQQLLDVGVRTARPTWTTEGSRLELTAAGDESLVIDASPAVAESTTGTTHAAAAEALLGKAISPKPSFTATVLGGSVTVDTIEDRWNALVDLADRIGAQVYDDGLRDWWFTPTPTAVAATPHHTLAVGVGGTVLEPSRTLERDSWFNYVRVRYRWRNAAGADQQVTGTAYVNSGPYAITGPAGRRILAVERDVASTTAQANAVAGSILTRQLSRGDSVTVRAVAAYWLRPGMTVDVQLPTGDVLRHLVARVVFDVLEGTMTVTTRLPLAIDPASPDVIAPPTSTPPSQAPTPDPAPPARVRYVSEWALSSSASYRSNGDKRTDAPAASGVMWQGMFSGSYNGDQRSVGLFTGANSVAVPGKRGETAKTMSQAFGPGTGATVERIELVATCEHGWAHEFTAKVGFYNGTTIPATAPSTSPYVTVADWREDSTRTVNLTSPAFVKALAAGTARGITLGPARSSSTAYYGRLGTLKARVTYSK